MGLALTAKHFFANMGRHTLHVVFRVKSSRGAVTIQYPDERRPYSPRLRSLHRLVRREDGSPRCVACMMCETVCPAHCIYIVATEHPNPEIEKVPERFDIDLGKCVSAATASRPVPRTPSAWTPASSSSRPTTARA